jgi:hypothetical protein
MPPEKRAKGNDEEKINKRKSLTFSEYVNGKEIIHHIV